MKRVKEKGNLAFNHMTNLCDLCKRCKGFRKDNDLLYDCKYNIDNKGLYYGRVKDHMRMYKCKYFKRDLRYNTCRLQSKYYTNTCNGIKTIVRYKQGKYNFKIENK